MLSHAELLAFISTYGYLAVFIGAILEGEVVVFLAGFFAREAGVPFFCVILTALGGTIVSDFSWFLLGRYRGRWMLDRWTWTRRLADKSAVLLGKSPSLISVTMRFMYGLRTVIPFSMGMTNFPAGKFFLLDGIGAVAWVSLLSVLGYGLGGALEAAFGRLRHFEVLLVLCIITLFVIANPIVRVAKLLFRKLMEGRQ